MPQISIILPVYNTEQYLTRCLDALLVQTFSDFEVLCINDGSTDSSLDILNQYAQKDSRIRVITQENQGSGAARNTGLSLVQSPYLMFCDSDDWYEPQMCEMLYNAIEEHDVDIAMCNGTNTGSKTAPHASEFGIKLKFSGYVKLDSISKPKVNALLWQKIFKMDIVRKYDVGFYPGPHDDHTFVLNYISVAHTCYALSESYYNYYIRDDSQTGEVYIRTDDNINIIYVYEYIINFMKKHDVLADNLWITRTCLDLYNYWYGIIAAEFKVSFQEKVLCMLTHSHQEIKDILYPYLLSYFDTDITKNYFNEHLSKEDKENYPYLSVFFKDEVEPAFTNNNVIVFSADDNSLPYLSVALVALLQHANAVNNYDICILYAQISEANIQQTKDMVKCENVCLRFINIQSYLHEFDNHNDSALAIDIYDTKYFKFFIPKLFSNYDRALYLDVDQLVLTDIAPLFDVDLCGNKLGAVSDVEMYSQLIDTQTEDYFNALSLTYREKYFNIALLLFDIPSLKQVDLMERLHSFLGEASNTALTDQCFLNVEFNSAVCMLDMAWSVLPEISEEKMVFLSKTLFAAYFNSVKNMKIINYGAKSKPWQFYENKLAYRWWQYARQSSFYEVILFKNRVATSSTDPRVGEFMQKVWDLEYKVNMLEQKPSTCTEQKNCYANLRTFIHDKILAKLPEGRCKDMIFAVLRKGENILKNIKAAVLSS